MNNVTYVVQYLSIKIYTPPWGRVTHVMLRNPNNYYSAGISLK